MPIPRDNDFPGDWHRDDISRAGDSTTSEKEVKGEHFMETMGRIRLKERETRRRCQNEYATNDAEPTAHYYNVNINQK